MTTTSSSSAAAATDDARQTRRRRRVSFGFVEVRKYERIAGDHPETNLGVPLGIGWAFRSRPVRSVDGHERDKNDDREGQERQPAMMTTEDGRRRQDATQRRRRRPQRAPASVGRRDAQESPGGRVRRVAVRHPDGREGARKVQEADGEAQGRRGGRTNHGGSSASLPPPSDASARGS